MCVCVCVVPMWCANLDLRKAFDRIKYNALFGVFFVERAACIFKTYGFSVSCPSWIGTWMTTSNQTRGKTSKRSKSFVRECWFRIRDEKMEVSCSTLRTSLW